MASFLELLHAHGPSSQRGIRFGSAEAPLISYLELWSAAARQGALLGQRLQPGDKVLLVGDNSQSQVEALWPAGGPLWSRFAWPPGPPQSRADLPREPAGLAECSGAQAGWAEPEILARCAEVPFAGLAIFSMPRGREQPQAPRERDESDLAYVQFSSGTTLKPKP